MRVSKRHARGIRRDLTDHLGVLLVCNKLERFFSADLLPLSEGEKGSAFPTSLSSSSTIISSQSLDNLPRGNRDARHSNRPRVRREFLGRQNEGVHDVAEDG